jgi:hypothetical protein
MKRIVKPEKKPGKFRMPPLPSLEKSALRCSSCGASAFASCKCGVAYIPAGKLAMEAVKANLGKSNRAIAEETGVSEPTVRRARSGASNDAPEKSVGKDGKSYPAKRQSPPKGNGHASTKAGNVVQLRNAAAKMREDVKQAQAPATEDRKTQFKRAIRLLAELGLQGGDPEEYRGVVRDLDLQDAGSFLDAVRKHLLTDADAEKMPEAGE